MHVSGAGNIYVHCLTDVLVCQISLCYDIHNCLPHLLSSIFSSSPSPHPDLHKLDDSSGWNKSVLSFLVSSD